jgi:hypothetical protein
MSETNEYVNDVWLDIPTLEQAIEVPKNPTGGNKAKIKKMVVADPGLGLQIKLDVDPSVSDRTNCFVIIFHLGKKNADGVIEYHHQVIISSNVITGTLDLSDELIFVVPFIDTRYVADTQSELDYKIRIEYRENDIFLAGFERADILLKEDISSTQQFTCTVNGGTHSPPFQNPTPPADPNAMKYTNVLFHKSGGSFELSFPSHITNLSSSIAHLNKNGDAEGANYTIQALKPDTFTVHDKGFSWLTYPKSTENNAEVTSTNINIEPFVDTSPNTGIVNLNYPVGIDPVNPATEQVRISLS